MKLRVWLRREDQTVHNRIDPVHNTGIRLATGAFRTSRLERLYVEVGETQLFLRTNLRLCS